ncbi:MAG: nucleoside hydrolase [Anaerolineae bacterium]
MLIDSIQNSTEKVTLLTLGPMTNIAEMMQADPSVLSNLAMIYIMGGALAVPGNVMETDGELAEWNLYVDPLAAKVVIQSGAPITLIPLDATNQVPLTMAFYRRVASDMTTPSASFLYQVLNKNQGFVQSGEYFFWDTLAAAITADESLAQIEDRSLDVIDSGQTVVSDQGKSVRVAIGADGHRFETMFLNVLNGRSPDQAAAATPIPAAGDAQEEANMQIVRRYYQEVWGANDGSVLDEIAAPGFISYFLSDDTGSGTTTEMLKETIGFFHKAMPDLTVTISDIFADGNKVAARITLRGKHTGQFFNIAPSGNPVALYMQTQITLDQGKMTEEWISLDLLFLFVQMGGISEEQVGKLLGWN